MSSKPTGWHSKTLYQRKKSKGEGGGNKEGWRNGERKKEERKVHPGICDPPCLSSPGRHWFPYASLHILGVYTHKVTQNTYWLLLSFLPLRGDQAIERISPSHRLLLRSPLVFECITVGQPVHSQADACLNLFWLLALENRAAVSICACVSVGICAFVSLESVSKNGA